MTIDRADRIEDRSIDRDWTKRVKFKEESNRIERGHKNQGNVETVVVGRTNPEDNEMFAERSKEQKEKEDAEEMAVSGKLSSRRDQ